jgi:hypothetical protein
VLDPVETLARALLYEGYLLYPYRADAVKNRHRFTFGGLYPRAWCERQAGSDSHLCRTECLVVGKDARVEVEIRFLHLRERVLDGAPFQDGVERRVSILDRGVDEIGETRVAVEVPAEVQVAEGASFRQLPLSGVVRVAVATAGVDEVQRLSIQVENLVDVPLVDGRAARDEILLSTFVALHTLIRVENGELSSLLEPTPALETAARACKNQGTFPVLVGAEGDRSTLLSSPIVLYDYPNVAPESPGDLFDATEIDEILTLRILTLTDDEKAQIRRTDGRAKALLERVEALRPEELGRLHGRGVLGSITSQGVPLSSGTRVRVRPTRRADAFDLALDGRVAVVESVETDLEGRVLCAVTVEDDPGADLGRQGLPGHRFFFGPEELEPLP